MAHSAARTNLQQLAARTTLQQLLQSVRDFPPDPAVDMGQVVVAAIELLAEQEERITSLEGRLRAVGDVALDRWSALEANMRSLSDRTAALEANLRAVSEQLAATTARQAVLSDIVTRRSTPY